MRSRLPKALHTIGGRTLLAHVLSAAIQAGGGEIAVVVGPDHDAILRRGAQRFAQGAGLRAARAARHRACGAHGAQGDHARADDILVMFSDTPLVQPATLAKLRAALADGAAVAVLGFNAADPAGYGGC